MSDDSEKTVPVVAKKFRPYKIQGAAGSSEDMFYNAGWSSSEARRSHKSKVVGSNPTPATKNCCGLTAMCLSDCEM